MSPASRPGSGTAFSLLPAENATGNYVKIVQRVPVKSPSTTCPRTCHPGPGMSVSPTVRVDPKPSLYRRAEGLAMSGAAAGARPPGQSVADRHPGSGRLLHGGARLHHRQCRAALYRGRHGVSEDEASWVITTYLVANAVIVTATGFSPIALAARISSSLPDAVHGQFADVRVVAEPRDDADIPHPPGPGGWRHGACGAIHPGRRLPAGESAARALPCSALRWWWPRLSDPHWAVGLRTISAGPGVFLSTCRSVSS